MNRAKVLGDYLKAKFPAELLSDDLDRRLVELEQYCNELHVPDTDIIIDAPFPENAPEIRVDGEFILLNPLRRLGADGQYHELEGKLRVS